MPKSSEYWKQRFDQVEQTANNKSVRYTKQLEKKYAVAAQDIDEKINSWYQRLADNNGVSISEARKLLSASELKEFKWNVRDYIKYGQENALDQRWMKELENASAKFHINRLEALKIQCRQQIEIAMSNGQENLYDLLGDVYKDTFYHSCFEIQKGMGVGFDVSRLDEKQVSTMLSKPWSVDGENFSKKLWGNKTKLINNLDQELSRMVLTGSSPNKAIKNIMKAMDSSKYAAKRLVLTEQAYFTTLAQKDAFAELDVEEYEIVATLDSKTSDICQQMDGQHFPVKDMEPGLNAPPFHCFCRTTTCPYFNDEFSANDKRVAKNEETGEWYEVPANMTYPEWKKSFVDGGSKEDLKKLSKNDKIKVKKESSEAYKYIKEMCEVNDVEYRDVQKLPNKLSSDEIIERLAGGDMTKGSCSSLAFAYIGNRNGLDVLDFRGGESQYVFSLNGNIKKMLELPDVKGSVTMVKREISGTMEVLNNLELNKEYYLSTGRHAAIVRRLESGVEYLELQSNKQNGWMSFDKYGSMAATLNKRFGCRKTVDKSFGKVWEKSVVTIDVDSFKDNDEFKELLGYINTATNSQKKGVLGNVR